MPAAPKTDLMKKNNASGILIVVAIVVALGALVAMSIKGYKDNVKTMTAQTSPTILNVQEVRTKRYDSNDNPDGEDIAYDVTFSYTVGSKIYTAVASLESNDADAQRSSKVCYNPANPSRSAFAPANFVCGGSALGAVIAHPKA